MTRLPITQGLNLRKWLFKKGGLISGLTRGLRLVNSISTLTLDLTSCGLTRVGEYSRKFVYACRRMVALCTDLSVDLLKSGDFREQGPVFAVSRWVLQVGIQRKLTIICTLQFPFSLKDLEKERNGTDSNTAN